MAQKTQVVLTDDIDGSSATQTVTFAFQGVSYEIDLNDEHVKAIEESFSEWIDSARKTSGRGVSSSRRNSSGGGGSSRPARQDLNEVRSWARENGYTVSERGRVANSVLEAYDAAH